MKVAPLPPNEEERLAALAEYQIMDTAAESIFDSITLVASKICGVPISLITLIERNRQWYKSKIGLEGTETSRDVSFCAHAILDEQIMEVEDATKDERFYDNPFVTENPHIRFYAGIPLINPQGFKLGTLCVIDKEPKILNESQKESLRELSKIIIKFFEIKKAILNDLNKRKLAAEALATANLKLKKKLTEQKQSRQELLLLGEMSSVLQACVSSDEAYAAITKYCSQLFPTSSGLLYLLDQTRTYIEPVASWGDVNQTESFFAAENCWALRRSQSHFVTNPSKDLICKHMQTTSLAALYTCLPLMAQGENMGLLTLEFPSNKTPLDEAQRLLAMAMAEQIALAITNAKLRQTLHQQSICDPLTGLYNRRHLTEKLNNNIPRYSKNNIKLGFLLIDIDHFKRFNDTYGHEAGDLVLKKVASLLKDYVKTPNEVFRFGGEEFIVVFENMLGEEVKQHAENICKLISQEELTYNTIKLPNITFSIGIALYPEHGKTLDELFNSSDSAMYLAKNSGRNRVVMKDF